MSWQAIVVLAASLSTEAAISTSDSAEDNHRPQRSSLAPAAGMPPAFLPLSRHTEIPRPARQQSTRQLLEALSEPAWVLSARTEREPLRPQCPWHHPSVTWLIARCQGQTADRAQILSGLDRAIANRHDPQRRFNAALALALLGDARGLPILSQTLLDSSAGLARRTIAAYALAEMPRSLDPTRLRTVIEQWWPDKTTDNAPDIVPVRELREDERLVAGLLWAVVRVQLLRTRYDPTKDDLIVRAARCEATSVRKMAAIAFSGNAWPAVPTELEQLLADSEPQVRRTALAALVACPNKAGNHAVLRGARDQDPLVRHQAIALLARFPGPQTELCLEQLMDSGTAADRAQVTKVAGELQLDELLARATTDESGRVRLAAAQALTARTGPGASRAILRLLKDRSPAIQAAVVESASRLPAPQAMPILLEAAASTALTTRQAAAVAMAGHSTAARQFSPAAPAADRQRQLQALRRDWPTRPGSELADREPTQPASAPTTANARRIGELLAAWYRPPATNRSQLAAQLLDMGPAAVAPIETVLERHGSYPGPELLKLVLARLDSTYRLLSELWHADQARERAAAAALADDLEYRRMSPTQAVVVAELVRDRSADTWLLLMPLLERDHPAKAAELDIEGLRHPDNRIRESTCAAMSRRPEPTKGQLLRELFDDPSPAVRSAAMAAAGPTGDPSLAPDLIRFLAEQNPYLRLTVAVSLTQLSHPEGPAELRRLAFDSDFSVRRALASQAVRIADKNHRFAIFLLTATMEDKRLEVRQQALTGLEELFGKRFDRDRLGRNLSVDQQIVRWKAFLESSPTTSHLAN